MEPTHEFDAEEKLIEVISEMIREEYTPDAHVTEGNSRSRTLARLIVDLIRS